MEFDGHLYFTTGNQKPVYRQLKKNPDVEMCAMLPDNRWVRLAGRAVFDGSLSAKKRAFEVFPDFKHMYDTPENPVFEVFYLENPSASLFSMTSSPEKIL
jgi:uncharacterized pyridoxamine 5'-phosphate oxidase family protein